MAARLQISDDAPVEVKMAAVVQELAHVGEAVERIEGKLDDAIACKADRTEVQAVTTAIENKADQADFKELRRLVIGIIVGVGAFCATTLVGLVLVAVRLSR